LSTVVARGREGVEATPMDLQDDWDLLSFRSIGVVLDGGRRAPNELPWRKKSEFPLKVSLAYLLLVSVDLCGEGEGGRGFSRCYLRP
jgi:hypothetical protein